ncbi:hypothetical protein AKJ16_DCAP01098 [Drosera capensis]
MERFGRFISILLVMSSTMFRLFVVPFGLPDFWRGGHAWPHGISRDVRKRQGRNQQRSSNKDSKQRKAKRRIWSMLRNMIIEMKVICGAYNQKRALFTGTAEKKEQW